MGSKGGAAPNPFTARKVSTRFLRVPLLDWPGVKIGRKTEFRKLAAGRRPIFPYTPTPVVGYTLNGTTYDHRVMVLTGVREETLWAISESPESLSREGFDTYEAFRDYWKLRHRTYRPLSIVIVYSVRAWSQRADPMMMGERLVEHLYGEF